MLVHEICGKYDCTVPGPPFPPSQAPLPWFYPITRGSFRLSQKPVMEWETGLTHWTYRKRVKSNRKVRSC